MHESKTPNQLEDRLADGNQVFLNMMPKDEIEDRIRVCQQFKSLGMSPVPHIAARLVDRKKDVSVMLNKFVQQGGVTDSLIIAGDYNQRGFLCPAHG